MGRQIVYCGSCGRSLREEEFEQGRAHHIEHQPFCTDCRPMPESPPQPQTPRRGTDRIPKAAPKNRKTSTARIPLPPPSTRRSAVPRRKSNSAPMILGGAGVAGVLVLVLAIALGTSKSPEAAPVAQAVAPPASEPATTSMPESKEAAPRAKPAALPNRSRTPDAVAAELKVFAESEKDPNAILLRCEAARPVLAGTPHESLVSEIEARALAARKKAGGARQVSSTLETVRKLEAGDPEFERSEEILGLLKASLKIAGPERAKIEQEIAAYKKRVEAARMARAAVPKPQSPAKATPGSAPIRIESLTLVRAPDGAPVPGFDPIPDGGVLTLTESTGRNFNIVANLPQGMKVGSIRFHLSGGKTMIENSAPYAYMGNNGNVYRIWQSKPGTYRISARPFTKGGAKGTSGPAISVEFTLVDRAAAER